MRGKAKFWMALDVVTFMAAAAAATMYELKIGLIDFAERLWEGTLFWQVPMWSL